MRYLIMLVMLQPCLGSPNIQPKTIDPQIFSKTVYDTISALPLPQKEYLQIESAGGMTGPSAWRWFVIETQGQSPVQFMKAYFRLIDQKLTKAGILTSGPPQAKDTLGLWAFSLKSPDGNIAGTISIAARSLSATRFAIVVSSAVSPQRNSK